MYTQVPLVPLASRRVQVEESKVVVRDQPCHVLFDDETVQTVLAHVVWDKSSSWDQCIRVTLDTTIEGVDYLQQYIVDLDEFARDVNLFEVHLCHEDAILSVSSLLIDIMIELDCETQASLVQLVK